MIFILGGRGFVGSAFGRLCETQKRPYVIIDRLNYANFIGQECEIFINANGNSKKFMADRDPIWEFDASVRSVYSSLVDFKFKYYVYLSSCDVYLNCSNPEFTSEEQPIDITQQSSYGSHKYLAEQCVQRRAQNFLIVRCGGFVGPGLKKNPIFDILNGGPLWLSVNSELQYMHTDNAAEIVMHLIDRGLNGEIINVCGRGVIQLKEVIDLIGKEVSIQPGSSNVHYEINIQKLSKLVTVPETRASVIEFVKKELKEPLR